MRIVPVMTAMILTLLVGPGLTPGCRPFLASGVDVCAPLDGISP